ncbi:hypothetical protein JYU34_003012 [Plutella xylostella]|uniref:Fibronectin type-III domain-containing protein n=1 Tax=Plutella xylostella TaxID=51655 RepID=A0ABQ7QYY3_PLUXY|nr:hypothetical protein JYU34_003012 [Plutella xylostella]
MDYRNSGNYTCTLRTREGAWSVTHSVLVAPPPRAPSAPRLARASRHKLHLVWDPVVDPVAPIIGYTVWWSVSGAATARRAVGARGSAVLGALPCGAAVSVTLTAHTRTHASPHSPPLHVTTKGERPVAAPARSTVCGNSSALAVSLLAWRVACDVAWRVALRPAAPGAPWRDLPVDGDVIEATGLSPGTWYEVRVEARAAGGATVALYRAATLSADGEHIGEPVEIPVEADSRVSDSAGPARAAWRGVLSPALLAGALLALAGVAGGAALLLRRRPAPAPAPRAAPATPLYTTEPGKRNGKSLSPLHDGSLHEISPYATFSMGPGGAGGAGGAVSCALHSFGRAEPPGLAAPPPPLHNGGGGGGCGGGAGAGGRDSDSSSSSSLCVACAAHYSHHSGTHTHPSLYTDGRLFVRK